MSSPTIASGQEYVCGTCKKKLSTKYTLKQHEALCVDRLYCSCKALFKSKRGMVCHMRRHNHPVPEKFKYLFQRFKIPVRNSKNMRSSTKRMLLPKNHKSRLKVLTIHSSKIPTQKSSGPQTSYICFPPLKNIVLNNVGIVEHSASNSAVSQAQGNSINNSLQKCCNFPRNTFDFPNLPVSGGTSNPKVSVQVKDSLSQTDAVASSQVTNLVYTETQTTLSTIPEYINSFSDKTENVLCQTDDILGALDIPTTKIHSIATQVDCSEQTHVAGLQYGTSMTCPTNHQILHGCTNSSNYSNSQPINYQYASVQTQTKNKDLHSDYMWENDEVNVPSSASNVDSSLNSIWNDIQTQTDNLCCWDENRGILTNSYTQTCLNGTENETDLFSQLFDIQTQTDPNWDIPL